MNTKSGSASLTVTSLLIFIFSTIAVSMPVFNESNLLNGSISNISLDSFENESTEVITEQLSAEIEKPVVWNKKIIVRENGDVNVSFDLPDESSNIVIFDEKERKQIFNWEKNQSENEIVFLDNISNENTYNVSYETPAPEKIEINLSETRKEVTISAPEIYNYTDVLAYTSIENKVKMEEADKIKVYWKQEARYLDFVPFDEDGDGSVDKIEWIVPHLSEQTFEIIIITQAEHLDSERNFISDIYNQVKELDDIWSEEIPEGDYVRITFEKNLTNVNDITIYPRVTSGNPRIEVYERDGSNVIGEFTDLVSEEYNSIILTDLLGIQDTFDLRIIDGNIEFDHVIDPTTILSNTSSQAISLTSLDNRTFVIAWINGTTLIVNVMDTNGTSLTGNLIAASGATNGVDADSRVSVAGINSTHFVVAWDDGDAGSEDALARGYNRTGGNWFTAFQVEAGVGTPFLDMNIIAMNNRYQACFIDQAEGDADIHTYLYTSPTTLDGTEANLDTSAAPDVSLNNLFECAAINSSRFVAVWFDDGTGDSIVFSILDENRNTIIARTVIEAVGTLGQAAVTAINQTAFAVGYYDATNQRIRNRIYDIAGNALTAIATIDVSSGAQSRVAMATIKNHTTSDNGYVLAWNDRNASEIIAAVFNSTGSQMYNYTLASDENQTGLLFDIWGQETLNGTGLCDDTYVFAYVNETNSVITSTRYLNGSVSTGYCDYNNPLASINSPANITYNTSSIIFNITATDASPITNVMYTINNGITNKTMTSTNNVTWNATNSSVPDGIYEVRYFVFDINGNLNQSANRTFSVDTTPPNITINSPQPYAANYSNSSVLFNITLDSSGSACWYTIDDGITNKTMTSTNNVTWNATNSSVPDGLYTTIFYCNDSVGNRGTNNTQFRIDTTPPQVFISSPQAKNYTLNSFDLNFTVLDLGIGTDACWYTINGGLDNITLENCDNTTFISAQGTTTLIIYANDTLGNLNKTQNVTFFVDSINPLIQFRPPTFLNGSGSEKNWIFANVSVTETNFANITYTLFNTTGLVNQTTYTSLVTNINWTNLNNSFVNYTYNVTISDTLNNLNSTETRYLQLTTGDVNPPDIFFDSPSVNGYYYNLSSVYFQVTLSENGSLVRYQINNNGLNVTMNNTNNVTWNATNSSLPDGFYNITVYANDTSGNFGNRVRNFSVDTTYPAIDYSTGTEVNSFNVSRNWIFVNISVIELNENYINFTLYDSLGELITYSEFTDKTRIVNWTDLNEGNYRYNVTIVDLAGNRNSTSTRTIRLDTTSPNKVELISPLNNSYVNSTTQNLTVNSTDNLGLTNITLRVYNSTHSLINQTTSNINGLSSLSGIMYIFPYDGTFYWNYIVRDSAGNFNSTENSTVIIDTIKPLINYIAATETNGSQFERNWIFANVSVTETNFANITYDLYNNTNGATLVNRTTYFILDENTTQINFTNLNDANTTYFYNVTVRDLANNINSTDNRTIKLIDVTSPFLSIIDPKNKTYFTNISLPLDFTVSDLHLQSCWYNVDGGSNISISGCTATTFNVSQGFHNLFLFANDSVGLLSRSNITFTANSSLFQPVTGILSYGEGTVTTPRYRLWNGTNFGSELTANVTASGTIEWLSAKNSPSRDEYIIVTANSADDVSVRINGTNPITGVNCWHNGTTCNQPLNLTLTSTSVNRQKADVAYETTGEEALVVWSQGNTTPMYQIWNGTSWGQPLSLPQTLITSGDISYLKMTSHPFREEIALIMTNTTSLNVLIWNGTSWGCEPLTLRSNTLTPDVYQHADLAYEQNTGDLFIASTINGVTEFDYTTKSDGSCIYTTVSTTTYREEIEIITVGARYGSNNIMIMGDDVGSDDMDAVVWTGITFSNIPTTPDTTLYPDVSPNMEIAGSWAGTSDLGLALYSDAATSTVIDYFIYNISTNSWEDGAGNGFNAVGLTAFSDEEQNIKSYSYVNENKTLVIVQDDADDLWAKAYNGDTSTWLQPDNGAALETTVSSTSFPSFDFEFNYDRSGPSINVISPLSYYNSTNLLLNITLGENVTFCSYNIDYGLNSSMSSSNKKNYFATVNPVSEGQHNVSFSCEDVWENVRTITKNFTIDITNPLINFINSTEQNNTILERNWIFANVSVTETNFANITYTLFNTTGLVNQTTYTSLVTNINWTNLNNSFYFYNVTVRDLANNINFTETRTINLSSFPPIVNLIYPTNGLNFSSFLINQFNFSVSDSSSLSNCSLYGNWSNGWHLNQTIPNPSNNNSIIQNFSSVNTGTDGFYIWNVICTDIHGNSAFNSTNFTFGAFLFPDQLNPLSFNITQTNKNGTGNVTLFWNATNHSVAYRIYYSGSNLTNFTFLNQTSNTNYTDTTLSGNLRRFYRVDSWNPIGQNSSTSFFGTHIYELRRSNNTRNWISFPTNFSYLRTANNSLNDITNATSFTLWNATIQRRVTCNGFSCPNFPLCTTTNCNFDIEKGRGYELNINSSAPAAINWSGVGVVYNVTNITLTKNSTSFGKNWISTYANTSLVNALGLLTNITSSDSVSRWNPSSQTSQGYLYVPAFGFYVGTNFPIKMEEGYEISVNQTLNWTQI